MADGQFEVVGGDRGALAGEVAGIVPVEERAPTPIMEQLVESGRARLAVRPGFRPAMRRGDGADRLSQALESMRNEEPW